MFLARTQEELSAIVPVHAAPQDGAERTVHAAFAVPGVMPFNLVGVLHALTGPLAAAQVPVLAVSTHDTDVLLVREAQVDRAIHAWRGAGICVEESCL